MLEVLHAPGNIDENRKKDNFKTAVELHLVIDSGSFSSKSCKSNERITGKTHFIYRLPMPEHLVLLERKRIVILMPSVVKKLYS